VNKAVTALIAWLALTGCGPSIYQTYDYSKEYDPRKHEYIIGVADQVSVSIYRMPELSTTGTVRPDGVLTLPLVGDLMVAGNTPSQVREDIKLRLAEYVRDIVLVNVTVTGFNSYRFTVSGNVRHGGSFTQKYYVTVSEAIAMAGGPNKFAGDQVIVLRTDKDNKVREIPVSYKAILSGQHPEQDIAIVAGDTIVIQ